MSVFFSMGGYGFYIWSSFGMTALVVAAEVISLRVRHKRVMKHLNRKAGLTGVGQ